MNKVNQNFRQMHDKDLLFFAKISSDDVSESAHLYPEARKRVEDYAKAQKLKRWYFRNENATIEASFTAQYEFSGFTKLYIREEAHYA